MVRVTASNSTEFEHFKFSADAAELGIQPSDGSDDLETIPTTLGNGQDFVLVDTTREDDATPICWIYRQRFGCIELHVFND